jgi:thiamine biosynthesis lipoprotein
MNQSRFSLLKQASKRFWPAGNASARRISYTNYFEGVLGTSLELQIVSTRHTSGSDAEKALLAEIDRLDAIFNAYSPSSELCRWQNTFGEDIAVSPELAEVLADAEAWRKSTHGAFNPAVEGFTRFWKAIEKEGVAPSAHQLAVIGAHCQNPLWQVDKERGTARRLTQLPVTLNSIAKGFIIDRAATAASGVEGVEETLVNIGGDIRHIGKQKTRVAVADPYSDAENAVPLARIELSNQGIATSGNYRRGFSVGNRWFSHLIDPRSGAPVEDAVGVSVIAPCAATADVLATAFSVLQPEESLALASAWSEVGVLLIDRNRQCFTNEFWDALVRNNHSA